MVPVSRIPELVAGVRTLSAEVGLPIVCFGHAGNGFTFSNPGGGWEYPVLWAVTMLALAALGGGWYLTGGDLAALPERLKALRLPEWITLWQAHEPKPGARLI